MKSIIRKKTKALIKPVSSKSRLMVLAEKLHIQAHLAFTELRLRQPLSSDKNTRYQRAAVLDTLNDYWRRGLFPKNTYEINQRKPVFIDSNGTYCAVGYLMANTGYDDLAKYIDSSNKFVLVEDLSDNKTKEWLHHNGFKQDEAGLIQPGYSGVIIERVSYSFQDKILAGISIVACFALIAVVTFALIILRNRSVTRNKKWKSLFAIAIGAAAAIIIAFVLYLPPPATAVRSLTGGLLGGKETATCGSFIPFEADICQEFAEKGSATGWDYVDPF